MVRPAIVIDPLRAGPTFAATPICTCPAPLPPALSPTRIQSLGDAADQLQPAAICTERLTGPPRASALMLGGVTVAVQPAPCVTVMRRPATLSVPVRAGPSLAATRKPTVPVPLPMGAVVIVIQAAWLSAVQSHPAPADTAT